MEQPEPLSSKDTPLPSPEPRRRETNVAGLVRRIRNEIESGLLVPGSRLPPEPELAARFRVGRSSLREAIQRLDSLGLVQVKHGSGVFVAEGFIPGTLPDPLTGLLRGESLIELLEARKAVETKVVELACRRVSDDELSELDDLVNAAGVAITNPDRAGYRQYLAPTVEFHLAVARLSGNSFLVRLLTSLIGAHWDTSRSSTESEALMHQNTHDHRLILQALRARNGLAAATAMQSHLERFQARARQ